MSSTSNRKSLFMFSQQEDLVVNAIICDYQVLFRLLDAKPSDDWKFSSQKPRRS